MPTEIKLPQLGESVHEGTIGKWLKSPGDAVAKYEPLVEVITDKVNVEMPSPFAGRLERIVVQEGQTVAAGTVIALIEEAGARKAGPSAVAQAPAAAEAPPQPPPGQAPSPQTPPAGGPLQGPAPSPPQAPVPPAPSTAQVPQAKPPQAPPARPGGPHGDGQAGRQPAPSREALRLSPLVRRLAEEHGLRPEELETIHGTGTGGRITKEDVLGFLDARGGAREAVAGPAPGGPPPQGPADVAARPAGPGAAAVAPPSRPAEASSGVAAPAAAPGDELRPLTTVRRAIAERMARSKREIPHAYGVIEVDVTALVRHREAHKAVWRAREGVNITITAFLLHAAARALREVPVVNATFTPEGILLRRAINIGVGVAVPDGLIAPVIKDADQKSVVGLAKELEDLALRAREGRLLPDDIAGGTFTLTNPGMYGSVFSMPVINHPQAAILSADAIVRRPVVVGEGIAIREMVHLGLAFDHRVFDGVVALRFLNDIKQRFEGFAPVGDSPEC